MFPDSLQQSLKNSNNKRTRRENSISEDTNTDERLLVRITKRRMMMDEQQMDVDDGFQAGSSRLALNLVPIPSIDDTQTDFGDLSPLER